MKQGRPRRQPGTKRDRAFSGSAETGSDLVVNLPRRLDVRAVAALRDQLLGRRGNDLVIDAAEVEVVSALALEVIVSAARQWSADGRQIALRNPSVAFARTCNHLGLAPAAPWRTEPVELPRLMPNGEEGFPV
jgi:anti-anti-sigma regulatory factor